ncbi:ATP-grasp domain-containing protein [Streptomyces sp. SID3343]|uniref:ATP-grasp domain-containing protein n=1 Tax=Streptomyces sp. SID3343 TaxID=2690260 RepID=UPI00136BCC11|nr:ATP-grasp domain-containing protein [Streptomyces sp. SID3343]MYW01353.1 ATP-grasp domain-containing protein [Streptomyces sp. SID3343]
MAAPQRVAIVDAYSSAARLAPTFGARDISCVHVQSTPQIPRIYTESFTVGDFDANVVHRDDLDETVRALAELSPDHVIVGIESGVELADALSERLGLRSNGTAASLARRDKYLMIERIRQAGLRAAAQIRTSDPAEPAAWHAARGGRIVVKPLRSAGSDAVYFCDTPEQSAEAARAVLGTHSVLATRNEAVVAQEYLPGDEYYVNTVSLNGHHHVCDIWRTTHLSANGVLDLLEGAHLLPATGAVQEELIDYTFRVLDALGIRHGPAHTEVKYTPGRPVLIETGARLCGGDLPNLARHALGEAQLEWTADAYTRPERFLDRYNGRYRIRRHAACVGMVCPTAGKLRAYRGLAAIERLESLHELRVLVRPGEEIRRTVNDFTFPVVLYLAHDVESVVMRDIATMRHLDGNDFYDIA